MPLVQINIIENTMSDDQKKQIIEKVTNVMLSIEGEAMREVTWVVIEEWKSGALGIGGRQITSEMSRARAAGKGPQKG
jgi:4-oxalocrotonate tautomerase